MKNSETTNMILLDNLDASKLPELQGLKDFIQTANIQIQQLKSILLTQLENL